MRVLNTVEGGGLDHGVMGHIEKRYTIAGIKRLLKGPVTDNVTGQLILQRTTS